MVQNACGIPLRTGRCCSEPSTFNTSMKHAQCCGPVGSRFRRVARPTDEKGFAPLRSRPLLAATVMCFLAVAAACSDADPVTAPELTPQAILTPVDGGEPTYYQYEMTLSGSGGLPGWSNPSERHSRSLTQIYQWSGGERYWNIDSRFAAADAPLGSSYPVTSDVDVARGLKQRSSYSATARNGGTLSSSSFSLDRIPDGSAAPYDRIPMGGPLLARNAAAPNAATADAPSFTPDAMRTAMGDRLVVTEKGKERELERLKATFGAGQDLPDGDKEYRKAKADREVRIRFNPAIGAVTRITVLVSGKKQIETTRRYKREDKMWVLTSIETETFDESGRKLTRHQQDVANIQVR